MKSDRKDLSKVNRKLPRTAIGSRDATTKAVINKLVEKRATAMVQTTGDPIPTKQDLYPVIRESIQRAFDADRMMEVMPELEQVAQIAISSILSTKDLITTSLIYECDESEIPIELRGELIKKVREHIDKDFELPRKLYDILYEVLFKSGSYPLAILPESSIDQLINGDGGKVSLESIAGNGALRSEFEAPKGILGSIHKKQETSGFGLEALTSMGSSKPKEAESFKPMGDKFGEIRITDNFNITKLPNLTKLFVNNRVASAYNVSMESSDSKTTSKPDVKVNDISLHKRRHFKPERISQILPAEHAGRPSIGHPLDSFYPPESVIPVHVPGDFKSHVGYIIVLDQVGNGVSRYDLGNNTEAWSWISGTASSGLIKGAADGLGIDTQGSHEEWTYAKLNNAYGDIVEAKLTQALKNGVYGDSVTVARPEEVYRIMMARTLAQKNTQLLYIPAEQMVYFALDYTDRGIGRSRLEATRMLGTIRSALTFATMQSAVLNATRNMQYTIVLDPNDRNPQKSIDDIQYSIIQGYASRIPYTGSVDDVQAYMSNAGLTFNIEGNEYYPSTKVEVTDNTTEYRMPDQSTMEDLAKRHYRGLGIDPDLVLTPQNIEFATQVLSKDLITTRMTCKTQEQLEPLITHACKVFLLSSGICINNLFDIVREYYKPDEVETDEGVDTDDIEDVRVDADKDTDKNEFSDGEIGKVINLFLGGLRSYLPPPDMSMMTSQMDSYNSYAENVNTLMEVWVDSEMFGMENADKLQLDRMRTSISNYLKRNWLRENMVQPDIIEMFDNEEKRNEFVINMAEEASRFATLFSKIINRTDKRVNTVIEKELADADGFGGDDYSSGDDFGSGDMDSSDDYTDSDDSLDSGMDDDFDMDDEEMSDDSEDEFDMEDDSEDDLDMEEESDEEDLGIDKV